MKNILFISTPLQTINAISAIIHFNLNDYEVIICNNSKTVCNSIEEILYTYKIKNYRKIQFASFTELLQYYFKSKKIHSSHQLENIFIGDFEDRSHLILASINSNEKTETYLIDDGNNTIIGYANNFSITKLRRYRNISRFIKYFIVDLLIDRKKIISNSSIYSIFPPPEKIKSKYIKNKLEFLKEKLVSKDLKKRIYIIGSPFVELSIVSAKYYSNTIKNIKARHQAERLYYIPHRKENKEKLSDLISEKEILWVENSMNVELYFIQNNLYPKSIYGFGSSALFTLKELFSDAEVFNLGVRQFREDLTNTDKEYQLIENYYNSFGIENVTFDSMN